MSNIAPEAIKFHGLTFWPLAQKIRWEQGIRPHSKDTLKALKIVGKLNPEERLAAFIILGNFYSEVSAENKENHDR